MSDDFPRVRASYDAVAADYAASFGDELDHNPLHRGMIDCYAALVTRGSVGDVGCGPGHIAAYLAQRGLDVVGVDLSPQMIDVARSRYPALAFRVGSMTRLDVPDGAWDGLVAVYSIIHLPPDARDRAYREFARVLRTGAWILVAFHIESATSKAGESVHLAEFLGRAVDLDGYFISPDEAAAGLTDAGIDVLARAEREPWPDIEYPSRRAYLIGRRR